MKSVSHLLIVYENNYLGEIHPKSILQRKSLGESATFSNRVESGLVSQIQT